jgi:hypothetical protein
MIGLDTPEEYEQHMGKPLALSMVAFISALSLIAALAWLTLEDPADDPCEGSQRDVGAAVLADEGGDQDALINRAIIVRGKCAKHEPDEQAGKAGKAERD